MHAVIELIDSLWRLDVASPAVVTQLTGVALELYEDKFGYQRYRGVHALGAIECGHRPLANACHVRLEPSIDVSDDGLLEHFGIVARDFNPGILPEGQTSYVYRRAKDKVEMRWSFGSMTRRLRMVSVSQFVVQDSGAWEYWEAGATGKPDRELTGCIDDKRLAPIRAAFAKATWKTTKGTTAVCNEALGPASWIDYSGPKGAWQELRCTVDVLDADSATAIAELRKLQAAVAKVAVPGHAKS